MSSLAVYSCLQNGGSFFAFRRVCEDDLDNLLVEAIPGKIKVVTEYRVTIWKRKSDLWSLNLTFNSFRAIETWKLTRVIGAPLFITLNVKMLWLFKICSSQWKVGEKGKKSYPRKVFPYFWCEGPRWNYHPPPPLRGRESWEIGSSHGLPNCAECLAECVSTRGVWKSAELWEL